MQYQLKKLVEAGATVIFNDVTTAAPYNKVSFSPGKGRIIKSSFNQVSFEALGFQRDFIATDASGKRAAGIACNYRTAPALDIYFISNQDSNAKQINVSIRVEGRLPEIFDPVTCDAFVAREWKRINSRTIIPVKLEPNGSLFIVLQQQTNKQPAKQGNSWYQRTQVQSLEGLWTVAF